jgi:hypothetical protein
VWPLAIGNRLELGRADYAKVLHLVQSSQLTVKGVDLIDCDVARTRLKGCGEDGSLVCHAQLALLLRAVSALRPAEGYVQVACLSSLVSFTCPSRCCTASLRVASLRVLAFACGKHHLLHLHLIGAICAVPCVFWGVKVRQGSETGML